MDTPIVADDDDMVPGVPVIGGADAVVVDVLPTNGTEDVVAVLIERSVPPPGTVSEDVVKSD